MANVTTYLNKILSAVYGKDVRQSIYDSINAINTQVEGYVSAEKSRVTAEANRNSAEKIRVSNENDREAAEEERLTNEAERLEIYDDLCSQVADMLDELKNVAEGKITFSAIYPVGSIYMSVNNTSPASLFGGTWQSWGSGRVPIGVNTSDSEFSTVEKTGGSKYLQSHTHTFTGTAVTVTGGSHSHTLPYPVPSEPGYDYEGESYNAPFGTYSPQSELIEETDSETHSHTFTAKGTLSSTLYHLLYVEAYCIILVTGISSEVLFLYPKIKGGTHYEGILEHGTVCFYSSRRMAWIFPWRMRWPDLCTACIRCDRLSHGSDVCGQR